jgi:hypothetical protein
MLGFQMLGFQTLRFQILGFWNGLSCFVAALWSHHGLNPKPIVRWVCQVFLWVFLCHVNKIPQTTALHAVLLESSWWVGMHQLGLRLFPATRWKLLIIESFSQWKLSKIKTENCIGIWGRYWYCWKALNNSDLIEFISLFLELKCGRYWFCSGFCCWKFKQITKIGFGKKNQLNPQCVHTWANKIGYISSSW